ncbi:response regulator transcription factor [Prevotella sp.]|uniref:response regulator transcription factor n=1 Tax=Prevotella sp. TaxID=59823 RepID=UPI002F94C856
MENQKNKILVVDDESDIREILKFNLETYGYLTDTASSAEEALTKPLSSFDLILLDVMMGEMSGFDLAEKLKKDPATAQIPIIFLTALSTENDTVEGLNLGADDYIPKPFSIRELTARVRAVLRRTDNQTQTKDAHIIQYEGLKVDLDRKIVYVDNQEVAFTKTEFELLTTLLGEKGRVFSRQELISRIWPKDVLVLDRTVDVNITRMRKKIGRYAQYLQTRLGYGYTFNA